jgi:hypothetical protein
VAERAKLLTPEKGGKGKQGNRGNQGKQAMGGKK